MPKMDKRERGFILCSRLLQYLDGTADISDTSIPASINTYGM